MKNIFFNSKSSILGINARNLDYIYSHNRRSSFPLIDNKIRCKELLVENNIPVPETFAVIDGPKSLTNWESKIVDSSRFVVKPNRGMGGNGIILVNKVDENYIVDKEIWNKEDIEFHIKQIIGGAYSLDNTSDTAMIEQTLVNHKALEVFLSNNISGVTDLRMIYQFDKPVMGMLRVPTLKSGGKANLHQGGIGIGVDLVTGKTKNGCFLNKIITHHPDNNIELCGIDIPFFENIIEIGSKISTLVGIGYLGIDFVVDQEIGPVVLEVNARPGLNIQIANEQGLKEILQ